MTAQRAGRGALLRISLTDFRSYAALTWQPAPGISVVSGPNGSGKTNLLEAVSLLSPGRGLRGARIAELARLDGGGRWAVAARVSTGAGVAEIGTGTTPEGAADRRVFRLDGATPRTQAEVADVIASVWLTPQMDRLFQDSASGRRRFLDRLVTALEPAHARELAAHETAVAGRNRLLTQGPRDAAWLAGLEDAIARHAVAVTAGRSVMIAGMNAAPAWPSFPAARLALLDPIAERLAAEPAIAVEDWLRAALAGSRRGDEHAGTSLGAHRADLALSDAATGLPAALASTGQQKALLIGVVLAHAALIASRRGASPLLLLDEPLVHLDAERRAALFDGLRALPAQAILTGTDAEPFAPLASHARGWVSGGGELGVDARFAL